MTVTLDYATRSWPTLRVLTAANSAGSWQIQPSWGPGVAGFEVLRFTRCALPDEGAAIIRYHYGEIDGKVVGFNLNTATGTWQNLLNSDVLIQVLLSDGETWQTVWWGQCVAMRDACFPGADIPVGDIEYHCVDPLYRLRKRFLDRHQVYWDGHYYSGNRHPGYNATPRATAIDQIDDLSHGLGDFFNSDVTGAGFTTHTWPGLGALWTDQQAVEHALASSRVGTDPVFTLHGSLDQLAGYNTWNVKYLETARAFVERVLDRRRGRGLAFADWAYHTGTGPITPYITVRPQIKDTVFVDEIDGGTVEIEGAEGAGTLIDVDVIGDHRLGSDAPSTFSVSAASDIVYTGVELTSEPIRSMVTLCTADSSLEGRWSSTEEDAFVAADKITRALNAPQWDHVFHRYGIPRGWNFYANDGTGVGTGSRCDYRCDDDGSLIVPASSSSLDTSPLLVSFDNRLPIAAGYDYTSSPAVRYDGGLETSEKIYLPIQAWIRAHSSPDRWLPMHVDVHKRATGLTISRCMQDLHVSSSDDEGGQKRLVGKSTAGVRQTGNKYTVSQLALVVSLILPHRVRYQTGSAIGEVKKLHIPGYHLWVAHPGAIWSALPFLSSGGYTAQRNVLGGTATDPGIVRDDRDRMIRLAEEASIWYLTQRKNATWTLSDSGMDDSESWPQLGQLVDSLTFSGRTETLQTPITRFDYDHQKGCATWTTSWSDRDWR